MRLGLACVLLSLAGCRAVFGMLDPTTEGAPDGGDDDVDGGIDSAIDGSIDMALIDAAPVTTDHPTVADTFTCENSAGTNFSTQTSALSDGGPAPQICPVLFQFDLASIPTNATVIAAELHIFTDSDSGAACDVFQILEQWDEATVTSNDRIAGTAWTNAGVKPPNSRGNTVIATLNPNTPNTENVRPLELGVVAGWVANPGTNFGIAIVTNNDDGSRFTTKEGTANQRPFLRVTHAP